MLEQRPKRILIAEDDPMVRELLATRLGLAGYHTTSVRDGPSAIELVVRSDPDGVILDLNLPKMDGLEVLEALRKEVLPRRPRVMVVTARNAPDDVRRALSLGAVDYLAKPFDDRMLLARTARLMTVRRTRSVVSLDV
jgi:two-component system OmpR family response regulator